MVCPSGGYSGWHSSPRFQVQANRELSAKHSSGCGITLELSVASGNHNATTGRCNDGVHGHSMALIVFFRGINVGGHRRFRPSMLVRDLAAYDVVNVGAAGTLVVRKPGPRTRFLVELRQKLSFEVVVAVCDARDLIRLEMENPFGALPSHPEVVQFVSILSEDGRCKASLPIAFPSGEEWLVRIIGSRNRLVFGVYRRHMRAIGYLGQIARCWLTQKDDDAEECRQCCSYS